MSRLGCVLLLFFAAVIGGFAWIVQRGGGSRETPREAVPLSATGLAIPVEGVRAAALIDSWGQARAAGTRAHHAIDIPAERGTRVVAAADGVVEKLFESHDGGHTVYVRRTDPAWVDYYAHLDTYAPDLREGVAVHAGQWLGTVGSSGNADPGAPHLHYEIKRMGPGEKWWQGTDVNPYPLLTAGH